jgi:hypothetical protein
MNNNTSSLLLLLVSAASGLLIPNIVNASNLAVDLNQANEKMTLSNTLKPHDLSSKLATIHPDINGSDKPGMRQLIARYFIQESGPSWVQNQPYLSATYEKSSVSAVEVFQSLIG